MNQIVDEALSVARTAAEQARTAAVAALTHLAADVETEVPQIEQTAVADVIEFVPQQYRAEVQPYYDGLTSGALPKIEAATVAKIKTGLGWAIQRIDALNF